MIKALLAVLMLYGAQDSSLVLGPAEIYGESHRQELMHTTLGSIEVGRNYIENNFSGTLIQSLSAIPGIQARNIGSGQSHASIRGLWGHRMVIAVDGIKHEGQQWGEEHGLEIDPLGIDRVELIKGPSSLLFGSDAVGGVLSLFTNYLPTRSFQGRAQLNFRSNNLSTGVSAHLEGRKEHFFWRMHLGGTLYADYRVPTDSIEYYSYRIPLHERTLRNTAGREENASLMLGYVGEQLRNDFKVSVNDSKCGFFANAHGLEVRLSKINYDASRQDIDLPWQQVTHLTLHNHTHYHADRVLLEGDVAWQMNHREEHSEPVPHGYMPVPPDELERSFHKHCLTGKFGVTIPLSGQNRLQGGIDIEWQHNRRGGWGFILPDFETLSAGIYLLDRHHFSKELYIQAGLRYDPTWTAIHAYTDWFPTPGDGGKSIYKQRAVESKRHFDPFSWSVGVVWGLERWVLKGNLGKSFRVPAPKEMGADGVNYALFRYERGTADLLPEESYQMDLSVNWLGESLQVSLDPYLNYFPNYIYLNPSPAFEEGLQLYRYTQASVLRTGAELTIMYKILQRLELELKGEYLLARQMDGAKKGYSLPFTPPWGGNAGLTYRFSEEGYVRLDFRFAGAQNDIVPPEKATEGWYTLNFYAGKAFQSGRTTLKLGLRAENLLNRRYYDHTSYYRMIGVPEPGINLSLLLGIHF